MVSLRIVLPKLRVVVPRLLPCSAHRYRSRYRRWVPHAALADAMPMSFLGGHVNTCSSWPTTRYSTVAEASIRIAPRRVGDSFFFFLKDGAPTKFYPLSLPAPLPI